MVAFSLGSAVVGFLMATVLAVVVYWLRRPPLEKSQVEEPDLPIWFYWLADAPMFLDRRLVSSFYDAVLRPESRTTSIVLTEERTTSAEVKNSYGIKAAQVIPGLAEVSVGSEVSTTEALTRGESRTVVPIHNQPREVVSLALHYLENYYPRAQNSGALATASSALRRRDCRVWEELGDPKQKRWEPPELERIESRPRMLAFLDFPKTTKFIPMAVETDQGVLSVYEELVKDLQHPGVQECPSYPADPDDPEFSVKQNIYWQWFNDNWDAMTALVALERVTSGPGRPRWVNYRVPIQENLTLHLSVVGHEEYDTGVFAYNLIRRGWRHGIRVVGTVRAEPGLNVLAIYDK